MGRKSSKSDVVGGLSSELPKLVDFRGSELAPDVLARVLEETANIRGDGVDSVGNVFRSMTGLYFPALAPMILFRSTCLAPGFTYLVGPPQSGKTAIAYEISRWVAMHSGQIDFTETEGNATPGFAAAFLRHNREFLDNRFSYSRTSKFLSVVCHMLGVLDMYTYLSLGNLEIYSFVCGKKEALIAALKKAAVKKIDPDEVMDCSDVEIDDIATDEDKARLTDVVSKNSLKIPGDFPYPLHLVLDSVRGMMADEDETKLADGSFGRGWPMINLLMPRLVPMITERTNGKPIWMTWTQHVTEKPAATPYMPPEIHIPGGRNLQHKAYYILQVDRKGVSMKDANSSGYTIKLLCRKNKSGPVGESVEVDMSWALVPGADGVNRNYCWLNWHKATTKKLLAYGEPSNQEKNPGYKAIWNQLMDLTGMEKVQGSSRRGKAVSSRTNLSADKELIIAPKLEINEPITFSQFGALVYLRQDILKKLLLILNISEVKPYIPGYGYQAISHYRKAGLDDRVPEYVCPYYADLGTDPDIPKEVLEAQ
jgi:hypothetical protein